VLERLEARRRVTPAETAATLIMLIFVLVLVAGVVGGDRVGAEEMPPGERAAPGASASVPPDPEAEAWALVDVESGLYLAGENPDEPLPTASTANIMTALVVREEGVNLDEEVTISDQAESYVGTTYSNVGLIWGERVTVRDLLAATLIPSGTDAVYALAEHVGGGSVENFVGMMNEKASELGLDNTRFEDPAGLDATGNYSSAGDLAILAREALDYSLFAELVDTPEATISTQNREIEIFNTNQLLNTYPPATGVKTGTTPQAGANLVASAESNDESYILVVLGSEDQVRFVDSEALLEYAFGRYENRPLVSQDEVYGELTLPYRRGESVELAAAEDVTGLVDATSDVERRVTTQEAPPSADAGQALGEVEVLVDKQSVGQIPLVAQEGYEEASLWDRISYAAGSLLMWMRELLGGIFG
jgi:D-alanyl-D-alanine carboxypeptidase (penicillin-binding protein 5/6)